MLLTTHYPLLQRYRSILKDLRKARNNVRELPGVPFFLFGMGARRKLVYQSGRLMDSRTGEVIRQWDVAEETIAPPAYRVVIETRQGEVVEINEDERGLWLVENGQRSLISQSPLKLPGFEGHPFGLVLRVLHHEILVNIMDGLPLPNTLAYPRPWYRDGAMMAMVLKRTGNLDLIKDWILSLREPFDRNNAGESETDNLGQALYLVSLVSDRTHPLVGQILDLLPRYTRGKSLTGRTDFGEHPVYQTQWIRLGLASLGLDDPYEVPEVEDAYASLCWWANDKRASDITTDPSLDYPYLTWAADHFTSRQDGPVGSQDYPLTWEANASQADYPGMARISPAYADQWLCAPHTWHAAEMFLALIEQGR